MKAALPTRRNVYISFDYADIHEVNLVRAQAKNKNTDLDFIDRSIHDPLDVTNPDLIKNEIRRCLNLASVTLIYLSNITHESIWVEWEVRESINLKKGILAMHKGVKPPKRMPEWIGELGILVVPWSQSRLSLAIEQAAQLRN
jgi:hypothetical protein